MVPYNGAEMNHEEAIVNVRRAYRYVAAYQRRILDAFELFESRLNESAGKPFRHYLPWASFSTWVDGSTKPGARQGWGQPAAHWLPALYFESWWTFDHLAADREEAEHENPPDALHVVLQHVADTAWVTSFDQTLTENLLSEPADSILRITVIRVRHGLTKEASAAYWPHAGLMQLGVAEEAVLTAGERELHAASGDALWFKVVSIDALPDAAAFEREVLAPTAERVRLWWPT